MLRYKNLRWSNKPRPLSTAAIVDKLPLKKSKLTSKEKTWINTNGFNNEFLEVVSVKIECDPNSWQSAIEDALDLEDGANPEDYYFGTINTSLMETIENKNKDDHVLIEAGYGTNVFIKGTKKKTKETPTFLIWGLQSNLRLYAHPDIKNKYTYSYKTLKPYFHEAPLVYKLGQKNNPTSPKKFKKKLKNHKDLHVELSWYRDIPKQRTKKELNAKNLVSGFLPKIWI